MKSTNIYLIMHNNEITLHTESYGAAMDYLMEGKGSRVHMDRRNPRNRHRIQNGERLIGNVE